MMSYNKQENEKRETVADIEAEYREDVEKMDRRVLYQPTTDYVRRLLDRIEAAWKRERVEIATTAAGQAVNLTNEKYRNTPLGNAAMREALTRIKHLFRNINLCADTLGNEAYAIAEAALSAPARNCDRFHSYDEAVDYWNSHAKKPSEVIATWDIDGGKYHNIMEWLLATAAERKGEGDGR